MIRPRKMNDHEGCTLIKQGELKSLDPVPGIKYYLYEHPDGSVHGETMCATFDIAKTKEEYERLSEKEIESKIYNGEMSIAR